MNDSAISFISLVLLNGGFENNCNYWFQEMISHFNNLEGNTWHLQREICEVEGVFRLQIRPSNSVNGHSIVYRDSSLLGIPPFICLVPPTCKIGHAQRWRLITRWTLSGIAEMRGLLRSMQLDRCQKGWVVPSKVFFFLKVPP